MLGRTECPGLSAQRVPLLPSLRLRQAPCVSVQDGRARPQRSRHLTGHSPTSSHRGNKGAPSLQSHIHRRQLYFGGSEISTMTAALARALTHLPTSDLARPHGRCSGPLTHSLRTAAATGSHRDVTPDVPRVWPAPQSPRGQGCRRHRSCMNPSALTPAGRPSPNKDPPRQHAWLPGVPRTLVLPV